MNHGMGQLLGLAAVSVSLLFLPGSVAQGGPDEQPLAAVAASLTRFTYTLPSSERWTAVCDHDYCSIPGLAVIDISAEHTTRERTLTVSMSTQFRSSRGAYGKIEAGARSKSSRPSVLLDPGEFRIAARHPTSTTLVWTKRLPPDPKGYTVEIGARALGGHRGFTKVTGRGVAVVVDLTDSADDERS